MRGAGGALHQACVGGTGPRVGGGQRESHNDTGNEPPDEQEHNNSHNDLDATAGRSRIAAAYTVHATTPVVPCTDVSVVVVSHLLSLCLSPAVAVATALSLRRCIPCTARLGSFSIRCCCCCCCCCWRRWWWSEREKQKKLGRRKTTGRLKGSRRQQKKEEYKGGGQQAQVSARHVPVRLKRGCGSTISDLPHC